MDRPRHKQIIDELNYLNVKIKLITDGDVSGALLVSDDIYNIDIFFRHRRGTGRCISSFSFGCFRLSFSRQIFI